MDFFVAIVLLSLFYNKCIMDATGLVISFVHTWGLGIGIATIGHIHESLSIRRFGGQGPDINATH